MKHLGSFSSDVNLTSKAIDMGFDPELLFAQRKGYPESFTARKRKLFKEINSKFTETEKEGEERLIQLLIDENFINSFLLDFVLVDKSFSIREFMSMSKEVSPYLDKLNTSTLGKLLPQLIENFGEDR